MSRICKEQGFQDTVSQLIDGSQQRHLAPAVVAEKNFVMYRDDTQLTVV